MIATCPPRNVRLATAGKHLESVAKIPFIPLVTLQKNLSEYADRDIIMLGDWDGFYHVLLARGSGRRFYRIDPTLWEIESTVSGYVHPQQATVGYLIPAMLEAFRISKSGKQKLQLLASMPDVAQVFDIPCLPDAIDMYGVNRVKMDTKKRASMFSDYMPPSNVLTQMAAAKIAGCELLVNSDMPTVYKKASMAIGTYLHGRERQSDEKQVASDYGSCRAALCATPRPTVDYDAIDAIIHGVPPIVSRASVLASRSVDFDHFCVVDTHAPASEIAFKLVTLLGKDNHGFAEAGYFAMESAAKENNSRILQTLSLL